MIPIRDENPSRSFPFINIMLIIANIVVFFMQIRGSWQNMELVNKFSMIPSVFFNDPITNWYRPFTYVFLHGGWFHIIGNMLFLYIFGDNVEDILGHIRYLVFYFIAGLVGVLLQSIFSTNSHIPIIGASGAISGVITAYMLLFPLKKIVTLVFLGFFIMPVRIPAIFYIALWIIGQIFSSLTLLPYTGKIGGVAYLVHVGGIAFGFGYTLSRKRKLQRDYITR